MIKNANWIADILPENHKEMIFLAPECEKSNFYFLKDESSISILNDTSNVLFKIYKCFRDDKSYAKRLTKLKHNLKTFNEAKQKKIFRSEVDEAVNSYILYKFSKKNDCKNYEKNKDSKSFIEEIKNFSNKINKNVFIFNYSLKESLIKFNNEDILVYYTPDLKDIKQTDHIDIIKIILKSYSKIIINTYDNPIYKKHFKDWTRVKKPNQKSKLKVEYVWKNF